MIKHFVYTFLSLVFVCHTTLAQESDLLLHYDFSKISGSNVTDQSASGITARLMNNAKVEQMGKYHVLNLGTSNGYLDMTSNAGNIFNTCAKMRRCNTGSKRYYNSTKSKVKRKSFIK